MFRPLTDRVVIQRVFPKYKGLIITDGVGENPNVQRGRVLAVGPGWVRSDGVRHTQEVKPGDEVFFAPARSRVAVESVSAEIERFGDPNDLPQGAAREWAVVVVASNEIHAVIE